MTGRKRRLTAGVSRTALGLLAAGVASASLGAFVAVPEIARRLGYEPIVPAHTDSSAAEEQDRFLQAELAKLPPLPGPEEASNLAAPSARGSGSELRGVGVTGASRAAAREATAREAPDKTAVAPAAAGKGRSPVAGEAPDRANMPSDGATHGAPPKQGPRVDAPLAQMSNRTGAAHALSGAADAAPARDSARGGPASGRTGARPAPTREVRVSAAEKAGASRSSQEAAALPSALPPRDGAPSGQRPSQPVPLRIAAVAPPMEDTKQGKATTIASVLGPSAAADRKNGGRAVAPVPAGRSSGASPRLTALPHAGPVGNAGPVRSVVSSEATPGAARAAAVDLALVPEDGKLYRVRVGSFVSREAAERLRENLKRQAGVTAFLVRGQNGFQVQTGAYKHRGNAEKIADDLRTRRFQPQVTQDP